MADEYFPSCEKFWEKRELGRKYAGQKFYLLEIIKGGGIKRVALSSIDVDSRLLDTIVEVAKRDGIFIGLEKISLMEYVGKGGDMKNVPECAGLCGNPKCLDYSVNPSRQPSSSRRAPTQSSLLN